MHLNKIDEAINQGLSVERWGDLPQWQQALKGLLNIDAKQLELQHSVTIGEGSQLSELQTQQLREQLMMLHPWRKGPIHLFDLHIDTEWRSDWKWDRVLPHLDNLKGRLILDVGCGNGYHCLRMLGAGAKRVVGIDPSVKFVHQFYAIKHYLANIPVDVLPFGIETMPAVKLFDTVFSMGVLYHRRDPIAHIQELKALCRQNGQIVLETLILDSNKDEELIPEGRYAKMRNVWSIPSATKIINWMKQAGLENPKLVDTCTTTTEEQRSTQWMHFDSLSTFLDPNDSTKTIEGHPAPLRAVFIAKA